MLSDSSKLRSDMVVVVVGMLIIIVIIFSVIQVNLGKTCLPNPSNVNLACY